MLILFFLDKDTSPERKIPIHLPKHVCNCFDLEEYKRKKRSAQGLIIELAKNN
jgi:hypothetical protein